MSSTGLSKAEKKLANLRLKFKDSLPKKMTEVETIWLSLNESETIDDQLLNLHRLAHTIIGTAGTFGAVSVSTASRKLENTLKPLLEENYLSADIKITINELIENLKKISNEWEPTNIEYLEPLAINDEKEIQEGGLIYLVEDDNLLAQEIAIQLESDHFIVKVYNDIESFVSAFLETKPAAIIMDIIFDSGDSAGTSIIAELKPKYDKFPPVVFISTRKDIEARLAAADVGAQRYFTKPVDIKKLSKTLDGLVDRVVVDKYKVLLVDDDIELLEYYKSVLNQAGILVKAISNPLETLSAIKEFQPDVIVLDVYMPEYSGPQIAQVIRQDDHWAMTSIMFLSSESNLDLQLSAMNLGGESFMLKPIQEQHLIDSVVMKAKKSRWNYRLNYDLAKALRENEFKSIAADHHNIISVIDVNGKIISVNDKFCEISGYCHQELVGKTYELIKSTEQLENTSKEMWETVESGKLWQGNICYIAKSGDNIWLTSTMIPFVNEYGKPYKYILEQTDITKIVESEERLERSQEFANIGTWDWNIKTGEIYWSDRIWPLFGYDKAVTETTYENFLAAVHPDDRDLLSAAVSNCVESSTEYNIEHRVIWPDKSVHWLHESGDVIRNSKNEAMHMLGVVQDITVRKNSEFELNKSRDEANKANKAKSVFLSSMSHELRTPLNAIMGFSQLIHIDFENTLTDTQKENIDEILIASKHLLSLINDVLDLAKIESEEIDLLLENVIVGEVINQSLQLISPLASKRGISIDLYTNKEKIELKELLDNDVCVFSDFTRLKQVIINLLSNAVKYNSKNGSIEIHIDIIKDICRISVVDTGKGLTEEKKKRLFKSFDRLGEEKSDIEGTGIGLVITKAIITSMGGSIGVESKVGKGSDFWVEVPNVITNKEKTHTVQDVSHLSDDNILNKAGNKSILYIEDNLANLSLVTQFISNMPNIEILTATEGMTGVSIAIEKQPDLILLDINLPCMNGFEVLLELQKHKATSNITVIAISANAMKEDIEQGYAAGFNEYITKPIDLNGLLEKINYYLNEK